MAFVWATVGLIILIVAGDLLVRGAVGLALKANISRMMIGLSIVAFGTSAPELVISLDAAAFKGVPELGLGNAVGSNVANILLVLGVPALVAPMLCGARSLIRDTWIMISVSVIFVAFAFLGVFGFWQGLLFVCSLIAILTWTGLNSRNADDGVEDGLDEFDPETEAKRPLWISLLFILLGLIGLSGGANLLVENAIVIARDANVSEATIGLTLVAIGTSLPELATCIVAAVKREADVALGNVLGSNLFNLLGIVGITALVVPIPVPDSFLQFDLWVMLGAAFLLAPFAIWRIPLGRVAGVLFLGLYIGYMTLLFSTDIGAAEMTSAVEETRP